ncbi:hypothetical protein GCM10009599_12850 [Luteococcus peritonei]
MGCSNSTGASEDEGFAVGDGTYTRIPVDERTAAPELSGKDLDGKPLSLADHRGTVVVLNVWGSWCSPCRHEAPQLVEAAARTKGKAQFIGINTRDLDPAPAKAFARSFKITFPHFFDPDGSLLLQLKAIPPKAIPSTLVLDKQGRIAARILGETTASTLVGTVEDVAAGK